MNYTEIVYEGFNHEHRIIATESYNEVTKELISATAEGAPYIEVNEIREDGVEVRVLINCVNVMSIREAKPYNVDALHGHKEEEKEDDKAKEGKD